MYDLVSDTTFIGAENSEQVLEDEEPELESKPVRSKLTHKAPTRYFAEYMQDPFK